MAPTQKKSKTWEFFTELGDFKAKCTICSKILSHRGAGPYNLTRHLKSAHPLVLAGVQEDRMALDPNSIACTSQGVSSGIASTTSQLLFMSSASGSSGSSTTFAEAVPASALTNRRPQPSQNNISDYISKPLSLRKTEIVNKALLEMIVKNYLPFTIVESDSFKNFIKELSPSYLVPSRKTVSNALLIKYYNLVREDVAKILSQAEYISLTTDAWTSASHQQYVAVTAHFIIDNNIKAVMLECIPDAQRHTAQNLADLLKKICNDWHIINKIISVTADNASNIQAAIALLKWKQIPCFAHTINLIVQAALIEIKDIQNKVKTIVELFRRSVLASDRLTATQKQLGEPQLKVKQDVITRWNSTYDMFERILLIKRSVISTIATEYPSTPNLTIEDLQVLVKCCELLKHFKSVTEIMSAEKHVTVSQIIVLANLLKKKCEEFILQPDIPRNVMEMAIRFVNDLATRFRNVEDNKLLAVSTLLDPRFKTFGFPKEKKNSIDNAKKFLSNMAAKVPVENNLNTSENIPIMETTDAEPDKTYDIYDDFDMAVVDEVKRQNPTAAAIVEVDKYCDEPLISRKNNDPVQWWFAQRYTYPRLYDVAKKHFCIPATSNPSERVFSKAGHIITDRRNRLDGQKVRMIIFLQANM